VGDRPVLRDPMPRIGRDDRAGNTLAFAIAAPAAAPISAPD
jgi:hypothetical protein